MLLIYEQHKRRTRQLRSIRWNWTEKGKTAFEIEYDYFDNI